MRSTLLLALAACSPAMGPTTTGDTFGDTHQGHYHLGPVDWAQTQWTNSCGPYAPAAQTLEGVFLAGVDNTFNGAGQLCDACALITTKKDSKTLVVRIITTGVSNASGDMDLSPEAFQQLGDDGVREMSWQLAKCPASSGNLALQFQTGAHTDWTSFWVRNPRLPLARVEVKSSRHANFFALRRETDGTWNDDSGFGPGEFTLRFTATTGETATLTRSQFQPGEFVSGDSQL